MRKTLAFAFVLSLLAFDAAAATAALSRGWQFKDAAPAGLKIVNLIGDARIERGSAAGFYISVTVTAEADTQEQAEQLAAAVEFRTRDAGAASTFEVVLPEASFPIVYLEDGPKSFFGGRMYVNYLGERRRLSGKAGEGVRVRVDILVRAPAESSLELQNVFGESAATGFSGTLRLDGTRGRLTTQHGSGRVELDSGSGAVEVVDHQGEVRADSGSGAVTIRDCRCRILADTGSAAVKIVAGSGEADIDTGSGAVTVENFDGSLRVDTGSGAVRVSGSRGATELVAGTGSGGVSIDGDLSALRRLSIGSGSGSVAVAASAWPSMEIVIETGSGPVSIDLPTASQRRDSDGRSIVHLGAGDYSGRIETRSGAVALRASATVPRS